MKFFGDANLQLNKLKSAVIPIEEAFPATPKVGLLAFVNQILYICVDITQAGLPVWVPLTRELTLYTHTQSPASDTWVIDHNLGTTSVQVQVFGNDERVLIPDDIIINSANRVTVSLHAAITGRAIILSGHNDGNAKPTYSYTHYQTSPATQWVINHSLGREPIVRVFVGNQEVQPQSITHTNYNSLTVTFSSATQGVVKLV